MRGVINRPTPQTGSAAVKTAAKPRGGQPKTETVIPAAAVSAPVPKAQEQPLRPIPDADVPAGRLPRLDARLRAAADWVTACETCADIGCDHGRLGTVLLAENRCVHLLAADISAKSLAKAQARFASLGFTERSTFAVADGLDALTALPQGRADTVCILGMGGDTLAGILQRGNRRLSGAKLILGAQSELALVREALQTIGYRLVQERIVCADRHLYTLLLALPAQKAQPAYTERELMLGPCLLRDQPGEWHPWLLNRQKMLALAVTAMREASVQQNAGRLALAQRELAYTEEALQALAVMRFNGVAEGKESQ